MIFHVEHRKPGDEGPNTLYWDEDQRIAEGASCFVCGTLWGSPSSASRARGAGGHAPRVRPPYGCALDG